MPLLWSDERDKLCVIADAPPPWTSLPFASIQGITGEELLVYFPNHALTWPAICERLAWEFPSYARMAEIINGSSRARILPNGSRHPAVTMKQVMDMMVTGRRVFRKLWTDLVAVDPRAEDLHFQIEYRPPTTWNLLPEQLLPPVDLASVATRTSSNPYFFGVRNVSDFSYELVQARNGWFRAGEHRNARNPPAMPVGWNYSRAQIPPPLEEPKPMYAPVLSDSPESPPLGYAPLLQPPPGYMLVATVPSQDPIPMEDLAREQARLRRLQHKHNHRHEPVKPDLLMSSLPADVQWNVPKLIDLGMASINGEVILFLLSRYGGRLRTLELAASLTPADKRYDASEVKTRSQRLTVRLYRALEYQARIHGVTPESEKAYWRNHMETPPYGKHYTILESGPPPREGPVASQAPDGGR